MERDSQQCISLLPRETRSWKPHRYLARFGCNDEVVGKYVPRQLADVGKVFAPRGLNMTFRMEYVDVFLRVLHKSIKLVVCTCYYQPFPLDSPHQSAVVEWIESRKIDSRLIVYGHQHRPSRPKNAA